MDEGRWTRLASASIPVSGAALTCSKGTLWRFGGWDGGKYLDELSCLEIEGRERHDLDRPGVLDESKHSWELIDISTTIESETKIEG